MYTREDALRDTAILHRLEKKKQQAIMEINAEIEELEFEMEMEASNRRYEEIIQKHRMV